MRTSLRTTLRGNFLTSTTINHNTTTEQQSNFQSIDNNDFNIKIKIKVNINISIRVKSKVNIKDNFKNNIKQAGAELCQAQLSLKLASHKVGSS